MCMTRYIEYICFDAHACLRVCVFEFARVLACAIKYYNKHRLTSYLESLATSNNIHCSIENLNSKFDLDFKIKISSDPKTLIKLLKNKQHSFHFKSPCRQLIDILK